MSLIKVDDLNAATPLSALTSAATPNELFYLRSHSSPPTFDADTWRLTVKGVSEVALSLADLQAMSDVSATVTMECAGNGRSGMNPHPGGTPWDLGAASTTEVTGVPLAVVLAGVGVDDGTVEVLFTGADGGEVEPGRFETYRRSLPVDTARDPRVLIAWAMGGEPLVPAHGAPVRLVVPGWYGMASVKWLTEIETIAEPFSGYYQDVKYVYDGEDGLADGTPVTTARVRSLVTAPADGDLISGEVEVLGTAWSGEGAISSVEVSVDGGASWQYAELTSPKSPDAATLWKLAWAPGVGAHELVARATDAAGNVQPLEPVWNAHGYGNNAVHRVTVERH
ncbi:MAG: sulfite oxidase [Acidimicrobiia bacterium]